MVITQYAWFRGYKDMDPSLIPQFEEGERGCCSKAVGRTRLCHFAYNLGCVHDFEFRTVLGSSKLLC
ncbi:hypothetical protein BYT27DRAFT_7191119 [Phlegmacium glaucopus]|nr:hypothetical protein BYT27DRAFT_7191119 [Phlegmacium glaucopus]